MEMFRKKSKVRLEVEEDDIEDMHDPIVKMNDPFLEVSIPEGEPTIFSAIRYGDTDMVERQLRRSRDVNAKFEGGTYRVKNNSMAHRMQTSHYTPLHLSTLHSTCQAIELLLKHGADINILDEQHRTPLHFAIVANRLSVLRMLILHGANIDIQSSSGRSPLLESVMNESYDCARILIEAGAQLDLLDTKGTSVLHQLSFSRNPDMDMIKLVLDNKGDPNITNNRGSTPLMFVAAMKRHFSVKLARLLLEYGACINKKDKDGRAAIHFAVERKSTFTGSHSILLYLIQQGACLSTPDKSGRTLLEFAMKNMGLSTVKCLLLADCQRDAGTIMEHPQIVYLCGQMPEFRQWLLKELYTPRSLKRLSRGVIRACLSTDNLTNVHVLEIPKQLQDFILGRDIRSDDAMGYPEVR